LGYSVRLVARHALLLQTNVGAAEFIPIVSGRRYVVCQGAAKLVDSGRICQGRDANRKFGGSRYGL